MTMKKIETATSPFPNIKNDMLDRLSKEADGRIQKAQTVEEGSTGKKSYLASCKGVLFRVFFCGKEAFEADVRQASRLHA